VKLLGRCLVAIDPVDLRAILVKEEEKRSPQDLKLLENFISDFISPGRPVKNKIVC
jgi:hypothetical protein